MIDAHDLYIRPAVASDDAALQHLDRDYSTDIIWQMDVREIDGGRGISFRQVRLPRSMQATYPRPSVDVRAQLPQSALFLVASYQEQLIGYVTLTVPFSDHPTASGLITDLIVTRAWRRQGVGTALLQESIRWAKDREVHQLQIETQAKNYPAICFCIRHGFGFCGYNDQYYPNSYDIALFWGRVLR